MDTANLPRLGLINQSLTGKNALVTGGGTGIGRAICLTLGQQGANVGVLYRSSESAAREVVAEIVSCGGQALALEADVMSRDQVEQAIAQVISNFGSLDIVVNNAGITRIPCFCG